MNHFLLLEKLKNTESAQQSVHTVQIGEFCDQNSNMIFFPV